MYRKFIATIAAAAIAVTSVSATMAQAGDYRYTQHPRNTGGNEAVAAAIAGVAALFIIGKTLERNNNRREQVIIQQPHQPQKTYRQKHRHSHAHGHGHGHGANRHNGRTLNHWHTHSNGVRHKHPHKARHHRGDR